MRRVRLVVTWADHQIGYFAVDPETGWRIDAASRCIVVGHRMPRTMIPLDKVQTIVVEEVSS